MSDVVTWSLPGTTHIAVFKGDFYALGVRNIREAAEDFFEPGHAFIHGSIFECPRKSANDIGSKKVDAIDESFPVLFGLCILEGVAIDANTADDGLVADHVENLLGILFNVDVPNMFPTREFETLETVGQDLLQIFGAEVHSGKGSDADIFVIDFTHVST